MKKSNSSRMFGTAGTQRKRDRSRKAGQPPGFLAPSERPEADKARVLIMEFSADRFAQREIVDPEELRKINLSDDTVRWINIFGVRDVALLKVLGELLAIHPLALEDISTTDQRPRVEDYGNNMHIVLKGLKVEADGLIGSEQLSIVLNQFLVVTFQEASVGSGRDILDPIRDKLRKGSGIIRTYQEDYIAYRIVDAVIDNYFVLLEGVGDEIDRIQDVVLDHPEGDFLSDMHQKRRNIIYLKRSLWPLRSVILGMKHSEGSLFTMATQVFLRDAGEHVEQVIDIVETMSESLSSALETFLMGNGNRMNETMRVLTVLSAFFIPLTFIVGVYGMNFKHMPELAWRYGYPGVWFIMGLVTLGLLVFFRRRRWL
jgi:magnesium transporter